MRNLTAISFSLLLVLNSCSTDDAIAPLDPLNPQQTTFASRLLVEITDEAGRAIPDASIRVGNRLSSTNSYGMLIMHDVQLGESNYLTVQRDGYFHASRRFYAKQGSMAHVKIRMLSDHAQHGFSSDKEKFVTLHDGFANSDGSGIHFPANGIQWLNGNPYTGKVLVAAKLLNRNNEDLELVMPGDLVGLNASNDFGVLGSYGMIAVELRSETGEPLQLNPETPASLRMYIPPSQQASAPNELPLWYFDEVQGVWREEGKAIREGNSYVGEVTHFSFWNFDVWFDAVNLELTFADNEDQPHSNYRFCLTIPSLQLSSCAHTDEFGKARSPVAKNEPLEIRLYDRCGNLLHEVFSGPLNSDDAISIMADVPVSISTTVSGIAMGCNKEFLQNGIIMAFQGERSFYQSISGANQFTMDLQGCVAGPVQLKAFDSSGAQSEVLHYQYSPSITSDTLIACFSGEENTALIYIPELHYTVPFRFLSVEVNPAYTSIANYDSSGTRFLLVMDHAFPEIRLQEKSRINIPFPNAEGFYSEDLRVQLESFGGPGELITGRGVGNFETWGGEGNRYPFTFTFSVRRPK